MKYHYTLILIAFFSTTICIAQINPSKMVSVEFKSGMEDQNIPYFEDLIFGIDAAAVVTELNKMNVTTLRIPVSNALITYNKPEVIVNFVKQIHENGGQNFNVILGKRKWDLEKSANQEDWADNIAFAYNALKDAGLAQVVVGCVFDENRKLEGAQSNQTLWDNRHNGILSALDFLNAKTDNAFKTRTVFIHGKGYGSQFKGVKVSSEELLFPQKMALRCANYAYNFKLFDYPEPEDKSLAGWKNHYINICQLEEVYELGKELVFVGDAGDGLRGNSFEPGKNPYGGAGQYIIKALRDVFVEYGWQGMSFGPFLREGAPNNMGSTVLFAAYNNQLVPRNKQIEAWKTWFNTTRSTNNSVDITSQERWAAYPNPCNNFLTVKYAKPAILSIRNISGDILINMNIQGEATIDVSSLISGFYIVQIQGENGILTKKVFKK